MEEYIELEGKLQTSIIAMYALRCDRSSSRSTKGLSTGGNEGDVIDRV
jgi:hypothetical protein